jgi:uncharacterized protein with HEPN domain
MRIIAAHAYHRIDYDEVWATLRDDVPRMNEAIKRWRQTVEDDESQARPDRRDA